MKKGPTEKYGAGILDAGAAVKLASGVRDDSIARIWMVVLLFGFNFGIWRCAGKKDPNAKAPFWGTAAFAFGLLFPDWLTSIADRSRSSA